MNAHYNPNGAAPQQPMQNPFGNINPNSQMFNSFGGYQNFMNQFNSFAQTFPQQMQQMGMAAQNPQQAVQMMMNNGRMSQQDFERFRQMANMMTGRNL